MRCQVDGKAGWKFGPSGKCYSGTGAKKRAIAQGVAINRSKRSRGESEEHFSAKSDEIDRFTDAELEGFLGSNLNDMIDVLSEVSEIQPPPTSKEAGLIKKSDDELRIVWAEVYVPDFPDTQGNAMHRDDIRKMAHHFLSEGRTRRVNLQHTCDHPMTQDCGCARGSSVVESFIARDGDPIFVAGSWVAGIHVPDDQLWGGIKSGKINGFSMETFAVRNDNYLEFEIPDNGIVLGETSDANPNGGHKHTYSVQFDQNGKFLGGQTLETFGADSHSHAIRRMTATEAHGDHSHRFSVIDALLSANPQIS